MIALGSHDTEVGSQKLGAYMDAVRQILGGDQNGTLLGDKGAVPLQPVAADEPMRVADVQQVLIDAGFLPGGIADGICGYRTTAAIRLFQEYVRSVEGNAAIGIPDGVIGRKGREHLQRWKEGNLKANWQKSVALWESGSFGGEYRLWLNFMDRVKQHYTSEPNRMLQLVDAYSKPTDTKKVANWDFSPLHIHLIGIRRAQAAERHKFDDVLILVIKGLVFKFQGSTDPGHSSNKNGAPFLVQGQHDYHFGWHRGQYHALRPLHHGQHGVLVVRSKGDYSLTDADLERGLEVNGTINIHWGGRGVGRDVNSWSEGCQVVAGSGYINHENKLVDCSSFVAINNGSLSGKQTRGAYNVLADVVTALSADMPTSTVKYMLLVEDDLKLDPAISEIVSGARTEAQKAF